MQYVVLVDFGSTFTKAVVIERSQAKVVLSVKHPSTVKTDAGIAMEKCFDEIRAVIGEKAFEEAEIAASSSAAGGLRMAVVGLTEHLSISAGKNVAFGAGAKIIHVSSGMISEKEAEEIADLPLEMILFCGGYENGNRTVLLHNAHILAKSRITCPIIYGGNSVAAQEIRAVMVQENKECFLIPNIIPRVGELNTKGGEEIIRELFMKRIVNMKGLESVQRTVGEITPTPAAVLAAGNLLARGCEGKKGYEDLMIVDIGGATTDIHSYAEHVSGEGAKLIGAAEPYAKRTVEGDLGMRESSDSLVHDAGVEIFAAELGITPEELKESIHRRITDTDFLPVSELEGKIDQKIAEYAARAAARRHAGRWEYVHSSNCNKLQTGKNLGRVKYILGTGGQIINSSDRLSILKEVLKNGAKDEQILLPRDGEFFVDSEYILYAAGLLSRKDPKLAFSVMENSIMKNKLI